MFQNVMEKEENKINIFSNVFAMKNIVVYVISFMLSMVGLGGEFSVFSISMLGACFASSVPALGVMIVGLIGNAIKYGVGGALGYFLTALVMVVTLFIVKPIYNEKERNEKIKIGKHIFLSILIIQIVKLAMAGFTIYDVLSGITLAIIGLVFYKIFVNSTVVLQEFWERRAFTIEELIGASLILSIAVASFGDISLFGFGIKNILSILIVMILGWKNGILVGTTAGVTIRSYPRSHYRFRTNYDSCVCYFWYDGRDLKSTWKNRSSRRICFRKCTISLRIKWLYSGIDSF